MAAPTYTCDSCGGVFEFEWTDEEAKAEQAANGWGDVPREACSIVCDDCYQVLMRRAN